MQKIKNDEILFEEKISTILGNLDSAHDLAHVKRVVSMAKKLAKIEGAKLEVLVPAAWLHDIINLPKDHLLRAQASKLAAEAALKFLKSINYSAIYYPEIAHAIESHSFSGGIYPQTLEAKILQDADRLDALGAIGMARLFSVSTQMQRPFYHIKDPFALDREPNDKENALDHIEIKLKKIAKTMHTESAKKEAQKRLNFIELFIEQLKTEINP